MNEEPQEPKRPAPSNAAMNKMMWLAVALSPAGTILLITGETIANRGNGQVLPLVIFVLNPVLSCIGCCGMLTSPKRSKEMAILGGILLGLLFAVLNAVIGVFLGCACGAKF